MIKIMFVCHGNICRSPMAEFVFLDMIKKRGLEAEITASSSATSTEEIGNDIHYGTKRILDKYGISYLLQETCRVELGNVSQIDAKHSLALEILKEKNDPEAYAVINVSNPQKPTYRMVGMSEVLLGA